MSSGEVFTGPQRARIVEWPGALHAPSAAAGIEVEGVGPVGGRRGGGAGEPMSATTYLHCPLVTDDGARFLGEFAIGTNFGIALPTGTILFDEKIGGTVHLALGVPRIPRDRRQEPLGAALGPHLRPAHRRAAERGRGGRAGERGASASPAIQAAGVSGVRRRVLRRLGGVRKLVDPWFVVLVHVQLAALHDLEVLAIARVSASIEKVALVRPCDDLVVVTAGDLLGLLAVACWRRPARPRSQCCHPWSARWPCSGGCGSTAGGGDRDDVAHQLQ